MLRKTSEAFDLDRFVADDYGRAVAAVSRITGTRGGPEAEEAVQHALASLIRREEAVAEPVGAVAVLASADESGSLRIAAMAETAAREPDQLELAMAGLTLQQRQAATLHWFLGLDAEVIAACMGISSDTVRTELDRAEGSFRYALRIDAGAEGAAAETGDATGD